MIRFIILLSPVFVSFFWVVALLGNNKKENIPRVFLSKFMIFPLICYFTQFLYFAPLHLLYPYFDFVYQYAGGLILPVYYIYFRLLTVDKKFSLRIHARYLAIPAFLATLYCIGATLTPRNEYLTWLFDEHAFPYSPYIRFLGIMRLIFRIQFLLLIIITFAGNRILLHKYGERAGQFYSDSKDGKYNNSKMLNYSLIIIFIASFVAVAIGRSLLMSKDTIIYTVWSISTAMMFIIGYMGYNQKTINPAFDLQNIQDELNQPGDTLYEAQKELHNKVLIMFEDDKIYLNSQLNIMDIAQAVGTNRTYISSVINQQYNQNFCSFVNGYRVEELRNKILENRDYTNETLAEICGFGSVISLRRAVSAKTGMSLNEWKKHILLSEGY
jgi:AraC-like DNA-binding protein